MKSHLTKRIPVSFMTLFLLLGCSSKPKDNSPDWIRLTTRSVDNGYIVYVGKATARSTERAQFKAKGIAMEDLANECSMLPKGTRIEDRFLSQNEVEITAYVKIAVEFQDCETGKHALTPEQIRQVANSEMTQQLKQYQDFMETGELANNQTTLDLPSTAEIDPPPSPEKSYNSDSHFYVTRQYIAYQKEIVVLAPPASYAPLSPASTSLTKHLTTATQFISTQEQSNPILKTKPQAWSNIHDRPHIDRPKILRDSAPNRGVRANEVERLHPPHAQTPQAHQYNPGGKQQKRGYKRRRFKSDQDEQNQTH